MTFQANPDPDGPNKNVIENSSLVFFYIFLKDRGMDWFRLRVSKAIGKTIAVTPLQPFKVFHLNFL